MHANSFIWIIFKTHVCTFWDDGKLFLKQSTGIIQMAIVSWIQWFSVSNDMHGNSCDCIPHTEFSTVFTFLLCSDKETIRLHFDILFHLK